MQLLSILEWKWDIISMDFVMILPRTSNGSNTIWIIVDKLAKSVHLILMKISYPLQKLVEVYIKKIVNLHGIPSSIVLNKYLRFTLRFYESL